MSHQELLWKTSATIPIGRVAPTSAEMKRKSFPIGCCWTTPPRLEPSVQYQRSPVMKVSTAQVTFTNLSSQRLVFFSSPEPFVFGVWTKTDKCSESCGKEGRVLEQRSCTPTHPHKSCFSLPIERTLRLSAEPCADPPCEGLFSVEIFVIKRKHLQRFTRNVRTGQSAKLQTARKTKTWPS